MKSPHVITVTRPAPGAGAQDATTGAWTPTVPAVPDTVVFSGKGEMLHKIRQLRKTADRDQDVVSEADVFLDGKRLDLYALKTDDRVTVVDAKAEKTFKAKLIEVDHLKSRLFIADIQVV